MLEPAHDLGVVVAELSLADRLHGEIVALRSTATAALRSRGVVETGGGTPVGSWLGEDVLLGGKLVLAQDAHRAGQAVGAVVCMMYP